jgi:uncharacterized delta-60 repeat protein
MRLNRILAFVLSASSLISPALADDGDLDPRYGDGGVARHAKQGDTDSTGIACAADGSCYACMSTTPVNRFRVREITPGGLFIDDAITDFNLGVSDRPLSIGLGADGKPVLAGMAHDGTEYRMAVARFTHPGLNLDNSFSGDGRVMQDFNGDAEAWSVAIGPSGEIVIAGFYDSGGASGADFAVMRFLSDGTPDSNFDGNGVRTIDFNHGSAGDHDVAEAVAVLPDGRIVVAGSAQYGATDYDFAVARLNVNGSLDASFSGDGMQTVYFDLGTTDEDRAFSMAIDRFGRVVLAGLAKTDAGYRPALARLLSNGNLDPSFGNSVPTSNGKYLDFEGDYRWAKGVAVLSFPSERILFLNSDDTLGFLVDDGSHLDPAVGGGYIVFQDPDAIAQYVQALTTFGGMPVVAGVSNVANVLNHVVIRYWMDQIFGDDFESGNLNGWIGW